MLPFIAPSPHDLDRCAAPFTLFPAAFRLTSKRHQARAFSRRHRRWFFNSRLLNQLAIFIEVEYDRDAFAIASPSRDDYNIFANLVSNEKTFEVSKTSKV